MQFTTKSGRNVSIKVERTRHTFRVANGFIGGDRRSTSGTIYTAWDAVTGEYVGSVRRDASGASGPTCINDAARWL